MKKFLAKLMFKVASENDKTEAEFDEQIRLIESKNLEEAFFKARGIGQREEETIINLKKGKIFWKFIDVTELYPIENLTDGEQLYSNTHKADDGQAFINYIKQKSMQIQVKNLTFA